MQVSRSSEVNDLAKQFASQLQQELAALNNAEKSIGSQDPNDPTSSSSTPQSSS
jgi:hypothetical protein